jgi:hypothetical protein
MTDTPDQHEDRERGEDTPTGTDPDAKYEGSGWEDKSIGQAEQQDEELVEDLLQETGGDEQAAEERFEKESAGAPAREKQGRPETS